MLEQINHWVALAGAVSGCLLAGWFARAVFDAWRDRRRPPPF